MTRQIELQRPNSIPIAAAALEECLHERDVDRIRDYEASYGVIAEKPIEPDELVDYEPISAAEFERAWQRARAALDPDSPRG